MKNQHGTRVPDHETINEFQTSSLCNSSKTKPEDLYPIHEFQFLQFIENQTKTQPHEDLNPQVPFL